MAGPHSAGGSGRLIPAGTWLPADGDSRLQGNRGLPALRDPYYREVGLIKARGRGALVGTVASRRLVALSRTVVTRGRVRAGSSSGHASTAGVSILDEPEPEPEPEPER
jgi:hypothetical protein